MASSLLTKESWWSSPGYAPLVAIGFISYASFCSLLRFQRIEKLKRRHNITDRDSLSRMTNDQAQEICLVLGSYEFPKFYDLAMQVALLKTYCIDSIAELLMQVSDLKSIKQAAKRYDDTEIILAAWAILFIMLKFKPESVDLHQAVARMNFLHSPYIKSGKVTNEDLLYVLGASMREPVEFIKKYDWRALTDMEVAALATLWMYIGRLMEIDYAAELGKDSWKDGLEFMDDVTHWISEYEDRHMRPSKDVLRLGSVLMELIMSTYPAFSRPAVYQGFSVLLGDRLRHVLGLKEPTIGATALVYGVLTVRQFFARYLMPPRIIPLEIVSDRNPKTGRLQHLRYLKEPWYNPVTVWSRWNSQAIITWLMGGLRPGDDAEMLPEGFKFGDIGPKNKMGKGAEVEAELEARAKHRVSGGCPFKV